MRRHLLLISCLLSFISISAVAAKSPENQAAKTELKASFATRAAALAAAKARGTIGECTNGLVAVVNTNTDASVTTLIEAENDDRNRLYLLLAAETQVTAALIGERNAMRNYQNARVGEWLRTRAGQGKKK